MCTGECVRDEYEHELYYNFFRDNAKFESMIGSKRTSLVEAYQRGRDAVEFLTFYQKIDDDYKNLLEASRGYDSLIVKMKLVPPYGTIPQMLLEKLRCIGDIFLKYDKNYTDPKVAQKNFNASLIDATVKTVKELDKKIEGLEIEEIIKLAKSIEEAHLGNCVKGREEICSVAALYDMLTLRNKLEEKNMQIKSLLNVDMKHLRNLLELFLGKNGTLFQMYNQSDHVERDTLKHMLEYYDDQVMLCLSECNKIYERILKSGHPTMKTAALYYSFMKELDNINQTIYDSCKAGGEAIESNFSVTSRRQLFWNITHLLTATESENVKKFRYNSIIVELVENMERKFFSYEYDEKLLNESLTDVENMNYLLNDFMDQSAQRMLKKSDFYGNFSSKNQSFHRGMIVN